METLHSLGAIHLALHNFDEAMSFLSEGHELTRQHNSQLLEVTFLIDISRLLQITGDLDQAEKMCVKALEVAERISSLSNVSKIHKHFAEIYDERQNPQSALEHFRAFHASYIKIFNEKSDQRVRALEIFHQLEVTRKQADLYREMAGTDLLTNLVNRRGLMENLSQAIARSKRQHSYGAVIFLDLNRFKQLNDSLGHDAGDRLLVLVADRLRAAVRATDTVARLGGDEFVVLLEGLGIGRQTASDLANTTAEKIRQLLTEEYDLGEHAYYASASLGITLFMGDSVNVDQILKDADAAMYADKRRF
jgi:diguanylate cyclase (GGDEF)-like protein